MERIEREREERERERERERCAKVRKEFKTTLVSPWQTYVSTRVNQVVILPSTFSNKLWKCPVTKFNVTTKHTYTGSVTSYL